ncbi:hypothetical protein O181_023657 [Austropuccinia psidii MF-1]|uniref:Uncharacterized protein n=1 Tax=Austropuccinia psidii MF-1 TaxID=1389203 RepID=A0A9Q3GY81_9BASI|nr:hypothetical protein [Austropuccinia psidii MF-1]
MNRKPQKGASIKGKASLITCTGNTTIINPVVSSQGKFPKEAEKNLYKAQSKVHTLRTEFFVLLEALLCPQCTSGTMELQGNSQRKDKDCSEPEDQGVEAIVDCTTLREIIPMLPFTFQFNRNLKTENWKDMDQVLKLQQVLKDFAQWRMDNKSFSLTSHWKALEESLQKIFLKEIPFKALMVITNTWNPNRQFKLLEERAARKKKSPATIKAIEEILNQKEHTIIPSGSQRVNQPDSPVASKNSSIKRSVARSHYSSQSQAVSRRRKR